MLRKPCSGFMADRAQTNWMAVKPVYGFGGTQEPMERREQSSFLDSMANLDKYMAKHIKSCLQSQHKKICLEYRNAKTTAKAEVKYHAICAWSLSIRAITKDDLPAL